jgi:ABC-type transporter Mla maintaining outer membrane lipid asymmetry ATPase subunit MlaF
VTPVLELLALSKGYGALRPLRVERLTVAAGERVAILGLDQPAAEVFTNLITGATLPDRGEVRVFGRPTASIADSSDWLTVLDRFGIVSERAVLLESLSVVQNLAMPFSLEIEPPAAPVRARAAELAGEVGLPADAWDRKIGELDGAARVRTRLARALALDPAIVLLEHATATVERGDLSSLGRDIQAVTARRGAAVLAVTADAAFAEALATRVLTLQPATGRLMPRRRWFG